MITKKCFVLGYVTLIYLNSGTLHITEVARETPQPEPFALLHSAWPPLLASLLSFGFGDLLQFSWQPSSSSNLRFRSCDLFDAWGLVDDILPCHPPARLSKNEYLETASTTSFKMWISFSRSKYTPACKASAFRKRDEFLGSDYSFS